MRCRHERDYQRLLALLLAKLRWCPETPIVASLGLLACLEDFGHLYYVANRSYWAQQFYFEYRVHDFQRILGAGKKLHVLVFCRSITSNVIVASLPGDCFISRQLSYLSLHPSYWYIIVVLQCEVPSQVGPGSERLL